MYQLEQQCDNRARAAHDLEAHTVNQPSSSILKRLHPKTTAAKTAACLLAGCALLAPLTAQAKPASLDDKLAATVEQYEQKPNEKKLAAIRDLLANLDERDRMVIELRFFENRTQEEIAEQIGVSQSYLSRILRRVLLDLRDRLGEEWDIAAV